MGIAYFVPVATRERPVSEGGARENPSLSLQQRSNGTLAPYPTKGNVQPALHICDNTSADSEHSGGDTNSSWLTYSTKEQQRALRREAAES